MTPLSKEILQSYQVRKSRAQKRAFFELLIPELERAGFSVKEDKHTFARNGNLIVGDPEKASVVFTAHYDTCAVLPVPNLITPRNLFWYLLYQFVIIIPLFLPAVVLLLLYSLLAPEPDPFIRLCIGYAGLFGVLYCLFFGKANQHTANDNTSGVITLIELLMALPPEKRGKVAAIFFDNEELGLLGSSAYADKNKVVKTSKPIINFDCVSDGDFIQFYPTRKAKKNEQLMAALEESFRIEDGMKESEVVKGFGFYPSDQVQFHYGIGVCALKKSRFFGFYLDRIHTNRDTMFDERNIELLVQGAMRLVDRMEGDLDE